MVYRDPRGGSQRSKEPWGEREEEKRKRGIRWDQTRKGEE
jgi:hypothetical protein